MTIELLPSLSLYPRLLESLERLPEDQRAGHYRNLCLNDLYFLLRYGCGRDDIEHPWLFERCREVGANPNGHIDLWARDHYKSTIITYGKTMQDVLGDPELTVCILSHTRPIAKKFLRQIMQEFEGNDFLKSIFPDVLYANPKKEAPKWSEDDGIILRRKGNPKESTIEAWGLVDSQPIAAHYNVLNYDDVVVPASVTNPDSLRKTQERLELSFNLSTRDGVKRYIGTRYHFSDSYKTLMDRGVATPRIHACTDDGTAKGNPVLLTEAQLQEKFAEMGPYTFATQMLLDPTGDASDRFLDEWLRYHTENGKRRDTWTYYILVDPAHSKKKGSDYTGVAVIAAGEDQNLYLVDMVRDRLGLVERADLLFRLHRKWKPIAVGYERYGLQADIEHIKDRQERDAYRFDIRELGGTMGHYERIKRLVPYFAAGRFYLPKDHWVTLVDGSHVNMTEVLVEEEYKAFPIQHVDLMDAMSRLMDEDMRLDFPGGETAVMPIGHIPPPGLHGTDGYDILNH